MAIVRYRLHRKISDSTYDIVRIETESSLVRISGSTTDTLDTRLREIDSRLHKLENSPFRFEEVTK